MSSCDHVCEINKLTGEVLFNDNVIVLRPKTFELLLLLTSKPNTIHAKSEILSSIWEGSVVEEQVVFQSINEIRKEFAIAQVIKTYPRRGYRWETPVTFIDEVGEQTLIKNKATSKQYKSTFLSIILMLVFSACLLTYFVLNNSPPNSQSLTLPNLSVDEETVQNHKGILVLPFNVSLLSDSQQWLRYGAMEGLIKRISPDKGITVFHLEDVIEILNRIAVGEHDDIDKIFAKSGASYILETTLSGQPGEMNVVHNIYSRTTRVTKTIQATNLEQMLTLLVKVFEESTDKHFAFKAGVFNHQLQNNLIAKAIQFLEVGDRISALSFIQSAVINEPNNIIAHFFLVKIKLQLGEMNEAIKAIDTALAIGDIKSLGHYNHRLEYFKGSALAALGQFEAAYIHLVTAQKQAKQNKDWLYYAYSQSMLGKLSITQSEFDQAYQFLDAALEYQELLNCPMGIAQGHLDFADFYLHKGDKSSALQSFNQAQALVVKKNLKQVDALLTEMALRLNLISQ